MSENTPKWSVECTECGFKAHGELDSMMDTHSEHERLAEHKAKIERSPWNKAH